MELGVNLPFQKHPATGVVRPAPPVGLAPFDSFSCRTLQPILWLAWTSRLGGEIEPVNVSMQTMFVLCRQVVGPFSPPPPHLASRCAARLSHNQLFAECDWPQLHARQGSNSDRDTRLGAQPSKFCCLGCLDRERRPRQLIPRARIAGLCSVLCLTFLFAPARGRVKLPGN